MNQEKKKGISRHERNLMQIQYDCLCKYKSYMRAFNGKVQTCPICGIKKYFPKCFLKVVNYCSQKCHYKSRIGKKASEETKEKMRIAAKLSENKGRFVKGIRPSIKTEFKKGTPIELHPSWKGGLSSANKRARGTTEFKEWRLKVFERDNWTCQECKKRGVKIHAHHIKKFADFPELRYEVSNGLTLCKMCHLTLHNLIKI